MKLKRVSAAEIEFPGQWTGVRVRLFLFFLSQCRHNEEAGPSCAQDSPVFAGPGRCQTAAGGAAEQGKAIR